MGYPALDDNATVGTKIELLLGYAEWVRPMDPAAATKAEREADQLYEQFIAAYKTQPPAKPMAGRYPVWAVVLAGLLACGITAYGVVQLGIAVQEVNRQR